MYRKKSLTAFGVICLASLLLVLAFVAACAEPAPTPAPVPAPAPAPAPKPVGEPVELTAVTFLPSFVGDVEVWLKLVDRVNERGKGELTIKYLGGPEVIGELDQAMACREGSVDIAFLPTAFYHGLVAAPDCLRLSPLTVQEERAVGALDLVQEFHEKVGLYYVGRGCTSMDLKFNLCTNIRVDTPYDLAGQTFQGGTGWDEILGSLGMAGIDVPDPEIFTALERGLIDGYMNPLYVAHDVGMAEVTKYFIDHPFYRDNLAFIMNLETWNGLPEHLQDLIMDIQIEMESEMEPEYTKIIRDGRENCIAVGMEPITFSPADAEYLIDTINRAEIDRQISLAPEDASRILKLLGW